MVVGLDSATPPTAAQVAAARAGGISLWNGYLQSHSGVGLYHAWTQADFQRVKALGGKTIAYVSGWDNPAAVKAIAQEWGLLICLDVESGIRGNGAWVQDFLTISGAGLYGAEIAHIGRTAPFHVLSWYPGYNPQKSYVSPRPSVPCGWQWENSHTEYGVTVDRCWFDDWFGGVNNMSTRRALVRLAYRSGLGREPESVAAIDGWANSNLDDEAMVMAIIDSSEGQKFAAKQAASGVAGPTGPQGPAGPPGPAGPQGPEGKLANPVNAQISFIN